MKNLLYVFLAVFIIIPSFSSCDDDDDDEYSEWRTNNENAFLAKADDPEFKEIKMEGVYPGTIYVKVIEEGPEDGISPILNDKVNVYYSGYYYTGPGPDSFFDKGTTNTNNTLQFIVNKTSVVQGFYIALVHMKPGDHWEVWIPWPLGYGDADYSKIPAYSTLVFDLKLRNIVE